MAECRISVIVPIYNIEPYLEECIKSIINQTYSHLEIILVDDGSTDHSGAICDRYAAMDDRILVIHKKNGGLVTARKAGLSVAKGEYIGFVDGDDYIEPDFYEVLYEEISEKKTDFVQCGAREERENGESTCLCSWEVDKYTVSDRKEVIINFFDNFLSHKGYINEFIWNKLFSKEFIKKQYELGPDYQQHGEDFICMCECMLNCRSFASLGKELYHYRLREDSLSHSSSVEMIAKMSNLIAIMRGKLQEHNCYFPEVKSLIDEIFWGCMQYHWQSAMEDILIHFYVPEPKKLFGKKIVLYGAGRCGWDYYKQLRMYSQIEIVAWADKRAEELECDYMQRVTPDAVISIDYDIVLIAVIAEEVAKEISRELIEKGIPEEKILWERPDCILESEFIQFIKEGGWKNE
ncbi:MAG: glycosyltransferase [Lachnospiraceae bacterium]|nr:glycosyltransferase [Lachnospiraceae bacterium]